jgi:hypothetical protein
MTRRYLTGLVTLACLGVVSAVAWTQPGRGSNGPMPDLVGGLKQVQGCLGVELASTPGGKQLIFAWFEDKQAVQRWYYSDTHMGIMDVVGPGDDAATKPLAHVPDDAGPIMVVASITPSQKPAFKGLDMPVSQIAIELYEPLPGGAFLGGRFAPKGAAIPHMKDLTPTNTSVGRP